MKIKPLAWTDVGIVSRARTIMGDYVVCDNFWKSPNGPVLEVHDYATAKEAATAHYEAIIGSTLEP